MVKLEAGYSLSEHVEGASRHLDAAARLLDLGQEGAALAQDKARREPHHSAKTLVKHPTLTVVLMSFQAGARLGEHRAAGPITLQTLTGAVQVRVANESIELPAGSLLTLERSIPHDVEARVDSTLLLTLGGSELTDRG